MFEGMAIFLGGNVMTTTLIHFSAIGCLVVGENAL
jgi:hypothetical protein